MNPFSLIPRLFFRIAFFVLIPVLVVALWFHDPETVLECVRAEDFSDVRDCVENVEIEEATRDAVEKVRRLEELGE